MPKPDGKRAEKIFARKRKLKTQPASGALKVPSLKGDVKSDDVLFDLKTTGKKQFTVTQAMMRKIEKEALGMDKMPCLAIRFDESDREYAVIRMDDFMEIQQEYFNEDS